MTTLPRFGTTGMTRNKIGFFGGTFNPVHVAHVDIANRFIEKFSLDLLYVIPNNIPPLKESHGVSGQERMDMLKLAFSGNDKVIISDIELKRDGMSYTCDTVNELKSLHPDSDIYMLMGDDWVDRFDRWKNYTYILENVNLVVAYRGQTDLTEFLDKIESVSGKRPSLLKNEIMEVSSTEVRKGICKSLLPDKVYEYIIERGLYLK